MSQQEIADGIGFSKAKTNGLMKELKELDCIRSFRGKNGKYQITTQGYEVLSTINGNIQTEK
jgi:DNA-binding IclR family transcriptional regulator